MGKFVKNLFTKSLAFLAIFSLIVTGVKAPIHADGPCDETGHVIDPLEIGVLIKDATCDKPGITRYTCINCGALVDKPLPEATGHVPVAGPSKESTCSKAGYTTVVCAVCGKELSKDELPLLPHTPVAGDSKSPSCTEGGYTKTVCSVCGAEIEKTDIPSLGHDWDAGNVTKSPTCTKSGNTEYTCNRCGAHRNDEENPPATGHHPVEGATQQPTCTEDGYTQVVCSICNEEISRTPIPARGHSWDGGVVTKEPTCTKSGETTYTCTICQAKKTDDTIPAALGHTADQGEVHDSTCTEDGYVKHKCVRCGEEMTTVVVPAKGHSFDQGTIIKQPTCTDPGQIEYTCTRCGFKKTDDNFPAALGHTPDQGEVKQPTCTEAGYSRHKCIRCGIQLDNQDIPALGHESDKGTVVKEATVTETGKIVYKCTRCGVVMKEEDIPMLVKRDTPQASFSTDNLKLSNIPDHSTVTVNGAIASQDASGSIDLASSFSQVGEYNIVITANAADNKVASDPQGIKVTKPNAPSHVSTTDAPYNGGNGYINGVDTSIEFTVAEKISWASCSGSNQPAGEGTYLVRYKATAGNIASDPVYAVVKKAEAHKPATPTAKFDGASHRLTNVAAGMQYSTDGGSNWKNITASSVELSEDEINQAIAYKFVCVKNVADGISSDVQKTEIARIAQPSRISTRMDSSDKGSITGVGSDMQYRHSGHETWHDIHGSTVSDLEKGKYYVRRKAIGCSVESNAIDVYVGSDAGREIKPSASFNAYNMRLDGVYGCKVSFDCGNSWTSRITDSSYVCNEAYVNTSSGIQIYKEGKNGLADSEKQYITLSKQATPTGITATSATETAPGCIFGTDASMQIRPANQDGWINITASSVPVVAGTYYIRRAGVGGALASDWLTVVVNTAAKIEHTVPTQVVPVDNVTTKTTPAATNSETTKPEAEAKKETAPANTDTKTEETNSADQKPAEEIKTEEPKPATENKSEAATITVDNPYSGQGEEPVLISGEKGWEAIEGTFETSTDPVVVSLNKATQIPSEVFVKAAETDTELVLATNASAVWSINPAEVNLEEVEALGRINLGIKNDSENIPKEALASVEDKEKNQVVNKTFDINHEGNFGFKANLTMKLKDVSEGEYANLFCYDPYTNSVEFIDSAIVNSNGEATFKMTHASSYVVVTSKEAMSQSDVKELKVEEVSKETSNTNTAASSKSTKMMSPVVICLIIIIIALVIGLIVVLLYQKNNEPFDIKKKKKHNK